MMRTGCRRCGTCCRWEGYVYLTDQDVDRLSHHLGLDVGEFTEGYTRIGENRRALSLIDKEDGSCVFLSGNLCGVYPARPRQCREFQRKWTVKEGCP